MATYLCDDGNCEIEIEADSAEEAAQEYVDGGDWGDASLTTTWVTVYVQEIDEDGEPVDEYPDSVKIALPPSEPRCSEKEHDWQSPFRILGGLEENPGVQAQGGGVVISEVCMHCGCGKHTDTWAQDMSDGEQGLTSISYVPDEYADELEEEESF